MKVWKATNRKVNRHGFFTTLEAAVDWLGVAPDGLIERLDHIPDQAETT